MIIVASACSSFCYLTEAGGSAASANFVAKTVPVLEKMSGAMAVSIVRTHLMS